MVLSYSLSDPKKSHVNGLRYSLFFRSIKNSICRCIVRCHQCWWLLTGNFFQGRYNGCRFLAVLKLFSQFLFHGWCHNIPHYAAFYMYWASFRGGLIVLLCWILFLRKNIHQICLVLWFLNVGCIQINMYNSSASSVFWYWILYVAL